MDFRAPTTRTQPRMWGKLTQQTVQRASRTTSHASARDAPAHTITKFTADGAQNIAAKRALNKLQIGREEFTA
jgi:hypothetical protein